MAFAEGKPYTMSIATSGMTPDKRQRRHKDVMRAPKGSEWLISDIYRTREQERYPVSVENGFKETEISPIPVDWEVAR